MSQRFREGTRIPFTERDAHIQLAGYDWGAKKLTMHQYVIRLKGLGLDNFQVIREIKWAKKLATKVDKIKGKVGKTTTIYYENKRK